MIKKAASSVTFVGGEKGSELFVRIKIQKWELGISSWATHFFFMSVESSIVAAEESVGRWVWPSAVVQLTLITVFLLLHIFSYFLYRVCAYYLKWKREEKNIYQIFQELVKYMVLTLLYFLASNYSDMFSCSIEHSIIEYGIPYLSALFISGFLCEASYFRVRLVDIASWKMNTWLVYSFIVFLFVFLSIISFIYCKRKDLFFIPLLPVIAYFVIGYILSRVVTHPRLAFHPRSYQLAFLTCLLRKENSFYCRLFAGICTGVFARCVAANSIQSILEVLPDPFDVENRPDSGYAAGGGSGGSGGAGVGAEESPTTLDRLDHLDRLEHLENIEDLEDLSRLANLPSSDRPEGRSVARSTAEAASAPRAESAPPSVAQPRAGEFAEAPKRSAAEFAPLRPAAFSLSASESSDAVDRPLLESSDALRAETALRDLSAAANTSLSSLSPAEREALESQQRSRASDVSDWNEQQMQDLFGSHEGGL